MIMSWEPPVGWEEQQAAGWQGVWLRREPGKWEAQLPDLAQDSSSGKG